MKKTLLFFLFLTLTVVGCWYVTTQPSRAPSIPPANSQVTSTAFVSTTLPAAVSSTAENKIQLDTVFLGSVLKSPAIVTGRARGPWYFEASFPVELRDANGTLLVQKAAHATSNWMTSDWVPFTVTLNFPSPTTTTGTLKFKNDNPSGDPARDEFYSIEVQF